MAHDLRSVWRPARVIENRRISEGSGWIVLEAADELPAAFDPGHVLGLGLRTAENSLMRHAYTVSRGAPALRRFEHLYRVIAGGRMSPRLAALSPEDEVFFHGPFHTPIQHEIHPQAEGIALISTGAGIGPLFGYAEKTLSEGEARPITLYAGFREESHSCLGGELSGLQVRYRNFDWHFTLTRPSGDWKGLAGRVTQCVPERIGGEGLQELHFHLVGNGEMVQLVKSALHAAGVLPDRVSIETYFNHYVHPDKDEVEQLAARFRQRRHATAR
jgi:NAD(P)H-flavin reductase